MLASLRASVLSLARDKALLVWALAFPIIMTLIFMGMFSGIQDAYTTVGSTLGVVRDKNYSAAMGLDETIQAISIPRRATASATWPTTKAPQTPKPPPTRPR